MGKESQMGAGPAKTRAYLSGPLFSVADIAWAGMIKTAIEERLGDRLEVVWPHELPCASAKDVFDGNVRALEGCDILVAILEGPQVDDGTAWEIGYHWSRGRTALGIRTDFRRAGEFEGSRVNAMIEGSCPIFGSLEGLLAELERLLG